MATTHTKRLDSIKEKMKALQEKEARLQTEILGQLSTYLIRSGALEVDLDLFMGGVLETLQKIKNKHPDAEDWKKAGQSFRQKQGDRRRSQTSQASRPA